MSDTPEPDNARLIRAMKMAARVRSDSNRKRLYHALVGSELWFAVTGGWTAENPLATENVVCAGEINGRRSAAVFTSRENATKWREEHQEYVLMNGTDLFGALIQTKVGSVQINPAGPIGGELYRHEVETIAEGGRILRLRAEAAASVH
jgi:hypothetical protein